MSRWKQDPKEVVSLVSMRPLIRGLRDSLVDQVLVCKHKDTDLKF